MPALRSVCLRIAVIALICAVPAVCIASGSAGEVEQSHDAISRVIMGVIFVVLFGLLLWDRVHRVLIAGTLTGIMFVITYTTAYHISPFQTAISASVDWHVIILLGSMMVLVAVWKTTNVFEWMIARAIERSRGNAGKLSATLMYLTGGLSAFADNVTTVLFVTPMALRAASLLRVSAWAFLMPVIMASNIGGTATLIGDPPNIMIGTGARLTFMDFIMNLTVPVCLMMVALSAISRRWYTREISASVSGAQFDARPEICDASLFRWLIFITGVVFLAFGTHHISGIPISVSALFGAVAALCLQDYFYIRTHRPTVEERTHGILRIIEKEIEWPVLMFFFFLFIIVGAAQHVGFIDDIARGLVRVVSAGTDALGLRSEKAVLLLAAMLVLWASGFLSAFLDNIPYTMSAIPIVHTMIREIGGEHGEVLWWALALGACLGGNGTLTGASANVTVVGIAERSGFRIGFSEFMRFGGLVTVATLLISTAYVAAYIYLGPRLTMSIGVCLLIAIIAYRATPPGFMRPAVQALRLKK